MTDTKREPESTEDQLARLRALRADLDIDGVSPDEFSRRLRAAGFLPGDLMALGMLNGDAGE